MGEKTKGLRPVLKKVVELTRNVFILTVATTCTLTSACKRCLEKQKMMTQKMMSQKARTSFIEGCHGGKIPEKNDLENASPELLHAALAAAVAGNQSHVIDALIKGYKFDSNVLTRHMIQAVQNGHRSVVEALCQGGANAEKGLPYAQSPQMIKLLCVYRGAPPSYLLADTKEMEKPEMT
jgi:hypothetical protein